MKLKLIFSTLLVLTSMSVHAAGEKDTETTSYWTGTCLDESAFIDTLYAEYGVRQNSLIGTEKSLSATIIEKWLKGQSLVSVRRIPSEHNFIGRKTMPSKCSYLFSKLGNEPKLNLSKQDLDKKRDEIFKLFQSKKTDLMKWDIWGCRETFDTNVFQNSSLLARRLTSVIEQNYRIAATITDEEDHKQCLYIFVRNLNDVEL